MEKEQISKAYEQGSEDSYTCAIPTLEQLEKVTFKQQQ
jgi:hypothetical protein